MRSIERVRSDAERLGLNVDVLELPASTRTAQEAADACGCGVAQIVKSMVFERADDHSLLLILVSGAHNANLKTLREKFGCRLKPARPDKVREVTGFAIGGVSPIGHLSPIPVFMDETLMHYGSVWAAAGKPNAVFLVNPAVLQEKTGAEVICVCA